MARMPCSLSFPTCCASLGLAGALLCGGCTVARVAPQSESRLAAGDRSRQKPDVFSWPDGLHAGSTLTIEKAVAVALWNNPDFQSALGDLGLSRAEVIKAGQLTNPSLSLLLPNDAKALEFVAKLPADLLWLRPQRVRAARLDAEAVARKLEQSGLDLARDVKLACIAVELARMKHRRAGESAGIFTQLAKLTDSQFKAGDTGELESTQVKANALVADQEALHWQYEESLAMEKLRALLGLSSSGDPFRLAALPSPRSSAPPALKKLIADALSSRPDIRAAELAVEAAAIKARLAPAEMLALSAGFKVTEGSGTQPSFDVALPVLNQNQGGRAVAHAQLDKALRLLNAARERAAADVRQARLRVEAARSVSAGWTRILPEVETSLTSAERSVTLGNASQLMTLDAARRLADARSKSAESDARLREAWAELERAVGKIKP